MLNKSLYAKIMAAVAEEKFNEKVMYKDSDESEQALNEVLFVLTVISARLSAAFLLAQMETKTPEVVADMSDEIVRTVSANFDKLLTQALREFTEILQDTIDDKGPTNH